MRAVDVLNGQFWDLSYRDRYSPNIKEMKVLDKKKVGRAKLYYLGDRMNPHKK